VPYKDPEKQRAYQREYQRARRSGSRIPPGSVDLPAPFRLRAAQDLVALLEEQIDAVRRDPAAGTLDSSSARALPTSTPPLAKANSHRPRRASRLADRKAAAKAASDLDRAGLRTPAAEAADERPYSDPLDEMSMSREERDRLNRAGERRRRPRRFRATCSALNTRPPRATDACSAEATETLRCTSPVCSHPRWIFFATCLWVTLASA
jgi:hypothetical protein